MSYCRWNEGASDLYVFRNAGDHCWHCMCCPLLGPEDRDFVAETREVMLAHLHEHERHGHSSGSAMARLEQEIADGQA